MDVVHAQRYLTKSFPIISKVPVTPFDKRILFETVNFLLFLSLFYYPLFLLLLDFP